jgi:hypothetical protein
LLLRLTWRLGALDHAVGHVDGIPRNKNDPIWIEEISAIPQMPVCTSRQAWLALTTSAGVHNLTFQSD